MIPEISVVIPTYNRLETLREVLPALLRQDVRADRYEIIVADSNSTDGTAEFVGGLQSSDPRVRYAPGPYTGRAMARNAGIERARGAIVMFTDSDILASTDLLSRHLERHAESPALAVVGMEVQVDTFAEYERKLADPALRNPMHPERRKRLSWLYFMTGNASVRRADLDRVGRFDEAFTGYGHEDLELGYRLEAAGVRIAYEPRAVNYHWQHIPYEEQQEKMHLAGRSTVRFYRKHTTLTVMTRLGMTPLSRAWHAALKRFPALLARFERAGARGPGFAREVVYQYRYLDGVEEALQS